MNIFVFGDSIAYGIWDQEGGWVQRIRKMLDGKNLSDPDKYYFIMYNLSIGGDTTKDILQRFEFELDRRIDKDEETMIIFAAGVNDSAWLVKEKRNTVSLDRFGNNIKRLAEKAKNYAKAVVFIGLVPVDKKKTSPVPWADNLIYNNIYIERYDSKLRSSCVESGAMFVSLYSRLIKIDYKKLLSDGLHPNSDGHQWISQRVLESLNL